MREGRAETVIAAPPERAMAVIEDFKAPVLRREAISRPTRTAEGWKEVTSRGETVSFVVEMMWAERIMLRSTSDPGYSGLWEAQLVAQGGDARISVTEQGEIRSPLGWVNSRLMLDPEASSISCLATLQAPREA